MVLMDEIQSILRLPTVTVEDMLAKARGYGVGAVLAAQALYQLGSDLRPAVMANTRSKIAMACGRDDATVLAREFGSGLTPDDLMGLDAFEAVAAVYAAGRTQQAATVRTLPPTPALRSAEAIKERSRTRFGADRADIEAGIRARLHLGTKPSGAIGRTRRVSP